MRAALEGPGGGRWYKPCRIDHTQPDQTSNHPWLLNPQQQNGSFFRLIKSVEKKGSLGVGLVVPPP